MEVLQNTVDTSSSVIGEGISVYSGAKGMTFDLEAGTIKRNSEAKTIFSNVVFKTIVAENYTIENDFYTISNGKITLNVGLGKVYE